MRASLVVRFDNASDAHMLTIMLAHIDLQSRPFTQGSLPWRVLGVSHFKQHHSEKIFYL
jgi:hypothetical protein